MGLLIRDAPSLKIIVKEGVEMACVEQHGDHQQVSHVGYGVQENTKIV